MSSAERQAEEPSFDARLLDFPRHMTCPPKVLMIRYLRLLLQNDAVGLLAASTARLSSSKDCWCTKKGRAGGEVGSGAVSTATRMRILWGGGNGILTRFRMG
uniref:Uncharacterized protein n=1 Tax=Photinus pyralis TaxID=7054 RepID=A0A1Y1M5Y4_PHOPY